jgi:phospholipase/lecithinase/hemolysin
MKKEFLITGFAISSVVFSQPASAANFNQVFVFGDSLSDTGNVANATNFILPPSPPPPQTSPYFQGRFSNGPLWVDYLSQELGLNPTLATSPNANTATQGVNFAFSGSTTGLNNAFPEIATLPGVLAQVNLFTQSLQANNQKADPNALYFVWGGGIDYLFGNATNPTEVVGNLANAITSLTTAGAKNIGVFNLADLGTLPFITNNPNNPPQLAAGLTALTQGHNAGLSNVTNALRSSTGANIFTVDVNQLLTNISMNPQRFGFINVANACFLADFDQVRAGNFTLCSNPNNFLYYDGVHPTTRGHNLIALTALNAVRANTIPEPSTVLGMLALGLIGGGFVKRGVRVKG